MTGRPDAAMSYGREPDLALSREDWQHLIEGVASCFDNEISAGNLLDRVGFPRSRRPVFAGGSPRQFWRAAFVQLENGIIQHPVRQVLQAAYAIYPYNPVFVELAERYRLIDYRAAKMPDGQRTLAAERVFISYVREDARAIDRLKQRLEAAGIRVWLDTSELWPGQDWRAEIRRAIRADALVFIACFSRNSVSRTTSYQNEELVLAIEELRRRPPGVPWLIPVRLDECDIPDIDIGGGRSLASIQRADLFGDRFDDAVGRLVAVVLRVLAAGSS